METAKPKPFKAEYAKSGRAACKKCKDPIAKDALRIARVVEAKQFDGYMTLWYHASCVLSNPGFFNSVDDIEGADLLRWEDQQRLKKYADGETLGGGGKGDPAGKGKAAGRTAKGEGFAGAHDEDVNDYSIEYAKSSRSTCKACEEKILKGEVRISKLAESESAQFRGKVPAWRHAPCFFKMDLWSGSAELLPGFQFLSKEDQVWVIEAKKAAEKGVMLEKRVPAEGGKEKASAEAEKGSAAKKRGRATKAEVLDDDAENATKGRGKRAEAQPAKKTSKVIDDDEEDDDDKPIAKVQASKRPRTGKNAPEEAGTVEEEKPRARKGRSAAAEDIDNSDDKRTKTMVSAAKRKVVKEDVEDQQKASAAERKGKKAKDVKSEEKKPQKSASDIQFEKDMEKQTKALWEIKDALRKHVTVKEMREMLTANGLDSSGPETELRERCADGMMFGPLGKCPMCSTPSLEYAEGQYRCRGFLSAWSKCTFGTWDSIRTDASWELPDDTDNDYLLLWQKKNKKVKPPIRLLPRQASPAVRQASSQALVVKAETQQIPEGTESDKPLQGLVIAFAGKLKRSQVQWKDSVTAAGGKLVTGITSATNCIITTDAEVERENAKLLEAKSNKIPIVRESFLEDCIEKKMRMRMAEYSLADGIKGHEIATVKVKGRAAVHEDSGLQDEGHILEVGDALYNTTLSLSDMTTGINSYYIMQVIEADKGKNCWVFRKWGRVGDAKRGSQKIEGMPKARAIEEFEALFEEKTGSRWAAWRNNSGDFQKFPGKFYPIEIDYGVDDKSKLRRHKEIGASSKLDPRVISLLQMLFDIETYKAAMLEFEINVSEMPLGKLSRRHIERGFAVLQEVQNLLQMRFDEQTAPRRDGMLVDASNRFYTLIPAVKPAPISTEEALKGKIMMLEALRDIEIAAKLISEEGDEGEDALDTNYKKLKCPIVPLPQDGREFNLIKKYLKNTHAPTHKEWGLELLDVFRVDREGEGDKYAPFRDELHNKMLLWHGSRTTNYVGILSQGLRIAPPEAPVTGYMFGKGIYFADLVSKSAQYCYTNKSNPVGLMLLSEVALGEMYVRKQAEVKLQFLLKVGFKYKR
ncbi:hypothetical protein CBR_g1120 [Chara braunii]|uniref:Poly [ADP-ribose] polymerase n=1 Tax=Chara braunii TaxID=69332 RepID=A0A388KD93_CHABU|nr:hypothetical protein CBR_g1120 [Chara braunii]|eukprot:GBG68001.1 hypothetical protein CBR_g1120 [Chara braunii]